MKEINVKPIPREAFTQVSFFEAKKHNMRQTNDGLWQLTFTVAEFDNADWLIHAPPGTPLAIGLKALDYDNPVQENENPHKKYVTKAAMFCKNPDFQEFLGTYSEEDASNNLRLQLRLNSRSELADNAEARDKLDEIIKKFKEWKNESTYKWE